MKSERIEWMCKNGYPNEWECERNNDWELKKKNSNARIEYKIEAMVVKIIS